MPATIVGSANGRSMSALTTRLPGNSSRTSTQAISVPADRVDRPRRAERAGSVNFSAATAWRRGDGVPERAEAALERLRDHGGQRQQDDQAQPQRRRSRAPRAPDRRRAARAGRTARGAG